MNEGQRNILAVYERANAETRQAGIDWYSDAWAWAADIASERNRSIESIVGATAALSPLCAWERNKAFVIDMLDYGDCDGQTGLNKWKAQMILEGGYPLKYLSGPKVTAFYHAILTPYEYNEAVIDRHAISIWLGRPSTERERGLSVKQRIRIQADYREVSYAVNLFPHHLQAVTWVQWRDVDKSGHD